MTARIDPPVHGTRTTYHNGCHCTPCTDANNEYARAYRANRLARGAHRLLHGRWVARYQRTPR